MDYYVLLGLHITAVGIWIGGMMLSSLAMHTETAATQAEGPSDRLARVLRWNRWITMPAMLLVWGLGIAMALQVGWYLFTWFKLKVMLVLVLSALQGIQSATLRRISRHTAPARLSPLMRYSSLITLVLTIIIIIFVTAKPFGA